MKKILFLVLINPLSAQALPLEEAQDLAVKSSLSRISLDAEVVEAEARLHSATLLGRPTIGIAGGAEYEGDEDEQTLLPLAYGFISYNIYNGDQNILRKKLAENELSAVKSGRPHQEREIRLKVKQHYLLIAYHRTRIRLLESEKVSFQNLKKSASRRQTAGLIGSADVLEFDLRATDLDSEIESSRAEIQKEIMLLSRLTQKVIEPSRFEIPSIQPIPSSGDYNSQVTTLALTRLRSQREASSIQRDLNATQWKPQIDFETRAGRLPSEGDLDNRKPRIDAILIAKWSLFTGGQEAAGRRESLAQSARLDAVYEEEIFHQESRQLELRQSLKDFEQKSASQARRKKPAERYYKAMVDEYNRGVKNAPDVAHAAETVFEIDQRLLDLKVQWAQSAFTLESLTGRALK